MCPSIRTRRLLSLADLLLVVSQYIIRHFVDCGRHHLQLMLNDHWYPRLLMLSDWLVIYLTYLQTPFPIIDSIGAMMIVWRLLLARLNIVYGSQTSNGGCRLSSSVTLAYAT